MYRGWYQVAFERELSGKLDATTIGDLRLLLVRGPDGVRAFNATCPHRGAHLARGGKLDNGAIICPFHGHRIGLGEDSSCAFRVRGYRTLAIGGSVFVLLDQQFDHGFRRYLEELNETHFFVPGFTLLAKTLPQLVIENGFDRNHFRAVHGLKHSPNLHLGKSVNRELVVEGTMETPGPVNWVSDADGAKSAEFRFSARVFSPNICVTQVGEHDGGYVVLSGATPGSDGQCTIRVTLAVPPRSDGAAPDQQVIRSLLRDSKLSYEQDIAIWENLLAQAPCHFDRDDDLVLEFHKFCRSFLEEHASEPRVVG